MSIVGGRACYALWGKKCQILTFLVDFTAGTLAHDLSSSSLRCIHSNFNCEQWHKEEENMSNLLLQWQQLEHDYMAIVAVLVALIQSPLLLLPVLQNTAPSLSSSSNGILRGHDLEQCS